ncbi:MAG: hypothetical protein KatS3mg008_0508 [Acidimicrobiales bacterium]|nr:MAG: hypothetical protein KatS3mg008_0508 [Acidimicrobiales bacterium]
MTVKRERFVLLTLASPRSTWATNLTRWATEGRIEVEVVRCVTVPELGARLSSGRRWSAVLLGELLRADAVAAAELAERHGVPSILVTSGRSPRQARDSGDSDCGAIRQTKSPIVALEVVDGMVDAELDPSELVRALEEYC